MNLPGRTFSRSPRVEAAGLTAGMTVVFAGVTVATSLLPSYRSRWDLSVSATTVLFAVYVLGVVFALIVFGRLADVVGSRTVVLIGLAVADAATVLALTSPALGWLLAARVLQGVAVGLVPGAVAAALNTLVTAPLPARLVSFATTGGIALGLLFGAAVAGLGTTVTWGAYLALLALPTLWAGVTVRRPSAARGRWSVQQPVVPQRGRREFSMALLGVAVAFAAMGLFAGLGPTLVGTRSDSVLLGAAVAASAYLVSGAVQLAGRTRRSDIRAGGAVLASGVAVLALAVSISNLLVLLVSALLVGAGNGLLFPPTLVTVNRLSPPGRQAGAVSTYYLGLYAGIAVPLLGLGVLTDATSLATAVQVFAAVVGVAALAMTLPGRDPPTPARAATHPPLLITDAKDGRCPISSPTR